MPAYYRLFISHAWKYGDDYERLVSLLDNEYSFNWLNWSAPEDKPAIPSWMTVPDQVVAQKIAEKVNAADCVIVIAGMYAHYSDWIQAEMNIALHLNKPLIGVKPWGSEKMPQAVSQRTKEDVGWNTGSIIYAIKRYIYPR